MLGHLKIKKEEIRVANHNIKLVDNLLSPYQTMAMSSSDLDDSEGWLAAAAEETPPPPPEEMAIRGSSWRVELLELKLSPLERWLVAALRGVPGALIGVFPAEIAGAKTGRTASPCQNKKFNLIF